MADFMQFAKGLNGKNPEAMVQNLLQSGKMSQAQFEALMQQAQNIANNPMLKNLIR